MNLRAAQQWLCRTILDDGICVSVAITNSDSGTSTMLSVDGPCPDDALKPKLLHGLDELMR